MKTESEIRAELARLEALLEDDDFPQYDETYQEEQDWSDTCAKIQAFKWVLGMKPE